MKNLLLIFSLISVATLLSCGDDDLPPLENEEEIIDKVTLTFTPTSGSPIVVTATDPDGEGVMDMSPDSEINLTSGIVYTLQLTFENTVEGEDITEEVEEEGDEHMIFFAFTSGIFSNPTGDGNMDNRTDPLNYNDEDSNGNELGLSTSWTGGSASTGGNFRIVLMHQPGSKSSTSDSSDGETDVDISWVINITNPVEAK